MLGRFKDCSIIAGCLIESEVTISFTNAGGADAVSAMNGALLKALRLPILLKASRKLEPLLKRRKKLLTQCPLLEHPLVHNTHHSQIQWASSTATKTRCCFITGQQNISRQGDDVAVSGDIITEKEGPIYQRSMNTAYNLMMHAPKRYFPDFTSSILSRAASHALIAEIPSCASFKT